MPLYEKHHSFGEFIFDWGWASAAQRAGIPYYPKLVSQIPYTPVTGPRLLVKRGENPEPLWEYLRQGAEQVAKRIRACSVNVLFNTAEEHHFLASKGWSGRDSYQFHWVNESGWRNFEDFLGALRSPDRKKIRRERRDVVEQGLNPILKRGTELTPGDWDVLWELYLLTQTSKGSQPYLTRGFFRWMAEKLPHRVVATLASEGGRVVAGSLFLQKGQGLYGRYWGDYGQHPFLHFELCYYLPIEWALAQGITRVEAGAQGEHKLKRGFMPRPCYSNHWIRHPGLARAITNWLPDEAEQVKLEMSTLADLGPFRRDVAPGDGGGQMNDL